MKDERDSYLWDQYEDFERRMKAMNQAFDAAIDQATTRPVGQRQCFDATPTPRLPTRMLVSCAQTMIRMGEWLLFAAGKEVAIEGVAPSRGSERPGAYDVPMFTLEHEPTVANSVKNDDEQ